MDSSGEYQWHTFYGSTQKDKFNSLTLDEAGNLIVVGGSEMSWSGPDGQLPLQPHPCPSEDTFSIALIKLESDGEYLWHTFYGRCSERLSTVSAGQNGDVVVSGATRSLWFGPDGEPPLNMGYEEECSNTYVMKVDSEGQYKWHTFYGMDTVDSTVSAYSHAVDEEGNIYVTGTTSGPWNGPNGESPVGPFPEISSQIFVLKLDSNGTYLWHTFHGSTKPYSWNEVGTSISIGNGGNLFVTGYSYDSWNGPNAESPLNPHSGGGSPDIVLLKLDHDGEYLWHSFFGSPAIAKNDQGQAIALDQEQGIYVTGLSDAWWKYGPSDIEPLNAYSGLSDAFVLKLTDSLQ